MPQHYKLSNPHYFGGKGSAGTYQKIINQIPPHDIRVIGFAGHCAVTRYMKPAGINFLIDRSHGIVDDWKSREKTSDEPGVIVPFCGDFMKWIFNVNSFVDLGYNVFVYLDPPYPMDSRKCSKSVYDFEMTDKEHEVLLYSIRNIRCEVAVSTYPNDLYRLVLKDWRLVEFESTTRHGKATEWLFMNYLEPTELHDYSYLGDNYREREKITKKQKSLVRKIGELTSLERAMLQERVGWL